jgi:DNA-binding IclR family transcriptional regulator
MSEQGVDRTALRRAIRDHIRGDATTWAATIHAVAADHDWPRGAVRDELVELERCGFVYRTGETTEAEVKLP